VSTDLEIIIPLIQEVLDGQKSVAAEFKVFDKTLIGLVHDLDNTKENFDHHKATSEKMWGKIDNLESTTNAINVSMMAVETKLNNAEPDKNQLISKAGLLDIIKWLIILLLAGGAGGISKDLLKGLLQN